MRCTVQAGLWVAAFSLISLAANAVSPVAKALSPGNVVGAYYLQHVREVGSQLILKSDGRFDFGLPYGAVDQVAQGRWVLRGNQVTLSTDKPPAASFTLGEKTEDLIGGYGDDPSKPTLVAVKIYTPRLGLNWSNIAVVAEFSNGKTRNGLTIDRGMLGFLDRNDADWKGAHINRVSVAYAKANLEPVWFNVDDIKTKSLIVYFEPGPLIPPAFNSMLLKVSRDVSGGITLIQKSESESGGKDWEYVKQPY